MPRKLKHALPLSVARHGDWYTEVDRVGMTALTRRLSTKKSSRLIEL